MLKRTITLVSLTITLGALLLALGCSGSNSNPVAPVSSDKTLVSRQEGNNPPSDPELRVGMTVWGYKYVGVRSEDPDGDRLQYKVVIEGNGIKLVYDQSGQSGEENKGEWYTTSWGDTPVDDFASGEWGFVKLFIPDGTYRITAQAFDGKSWSSNDSLKITFGFTQDSNGTTNGDSTTNSSGTTNGNDKSNGNGKSNGKNGR